MRGDGPRRQAPGSALVDGTTRVGCRPGALRRRLSIGEVPGGRSVGVAGRTGRARSRSSRPRPAVRRGRAAASRGHRPWARSRRHGRVRGSPSRPRFRGVRRPSGRWPAARARGARRDCVPRRSLRAGASKGWALCTVGPPREEYRTWATKVCETTLRAWSVKSVFWYAASGARSRTGSSPRENHPSPVPSGMRRLCSRRLPGASSNQKDARTRGPPVVIPNSRHTFLTSSFTAAGNVGDQYRSTVEGAATAPRASATASAAVFRNPERSGCLV
jgi:hypothetical protein